GRAAYRRATGRAGPPRRVAGAGGRDRGPARELEAEIPRLEQQGRPRAADRRAAGRARAAREGPSAEHLGRQARWPLTVTAGGPPARPLIRSLLAPRVGRAGLAPRLADEAADPVPGGDDAALGPGI